MRTAWIFGALFTAGAAPVVGQGILVDEGQFEIRIRGRVAGTEDFVIRRAAIGRDGAVFANGTVVVAVDGGRQEVRPLLQTMPPAGMATAYQVTVLGIDRLELALNRVRDRYVASISSEIGQEDREFQAREDTRVLERDVAHHYYFLRDLREGRTAHALVPRERGQISVTAGARVDEEIRVGRNVVQARRVEFTADDDRRVVWYDRQGRVLRVEIPALAYVAERTDIVG